MSELVIKRSTWLAIIACALLMRLSLFFMGPAQDINRSYRDDSEIYLELADHMLRFQSFGRDGDRGRTVESVGRLRDLNGTRPPKDAHGLWPDSIRTPGYPCFLLLGRLVNDHRLSVLLQCALGAFACGLLMLLISKRIGSKWGTTVAGLIWAIHPGLVISDNMLLTESHFNFIFILTLWLCTLRHWCYHWLLAGILLGYLGLIRPVGPAYFPIAIWAAWPYWRKKWLLLPGFLVLASLPSLAWAKHNEQRGEGFRVSCVGEWNLLFYQSAYAISEEKGEDWLKSWPTRVTEAEAHIQERLQPGEDVVALSAKMGIEEIKARPKAFAKTVAKSWIKLWIDHQMLDLMLAINVSYKPTGIFSRFVLGQPTEGEEVNRPQLLGGLAWVLFNVAIGFTMLLGIIRNCRRGYWFIAIMCALTIGANMAGVGALGCERFRMVIMVPILLLAIPGRPRDAASAPQTLQPVS